MKKKKLAKTIISCLLSGQLPRGSVLQLCLNWSRGSIPTPGASSVAIPLAIWIGFWMGGPVSVLLIITLHTCKIQSHSLKNPHKLNKIKTYKQ